MYGSHATLSVPINPSLISCAPRRMVVLCNGQAPVFGVYLHYEGSRDQAVMVFAPDGMPNMHGRAPAEICFVITDEQEREIRAEYARQVAAVDDDTPSRP